MKARELNGVNSTPCLVSPALETNGATTAGQCVQDDIPCVDRDGEVLEIDFL